MAAAVLGEAFLSAFVDVVFKRLANPEVANFIRGKKLDANLLQRLKNTLYAVEAVLNDAELKQINDSAVNKWLDDLKDAVYVADDLLDRLSTKAATQKEARVSNFFSRILNFQDRDIANQLEDILSKLESIFKLKDSLGLKEMARGSSLSRRIPSTSVDDGSKVYGRDKDREAVLKLLLDDDNSDTKVSVIPVVGMGGVGKTTLAQMVYNDDNLKKKFDLQAWACVSEEFDALKVTKTMMEAVCRGKCNTNDMNLLQLDLIEKITGKRFLIVLDDVWLEDYVTWNFLVKPFQYGAKGSKILVTTRKEKVAALVQTFQSHHLGQLSNADCWSVFENHARLSQKSGENMSLGKIGWEIVKKCKGLPLAAQSLGGLLRGKHDISDWSNVLNSNIWEFSESESKIIPALRISYHYLPPYLKRCFVYCCLYPKDCEFEKDELIMLWMAEDLIHPGKSEKTLEEVGSEHFDDLFLLSFFQRSSTTKWCFVMHDLVHDLATSIGGEFYFRLEEVGKETKVGIKTRHLSFSQLSDPVSKDFDVFGSARFLRTFLPIDPNLKDAPFKNEKAASIILLNFKCLRVLSFRRFSIEVVPDSIGELIHLRYLDLSETVIKTLPGSLCKLYNLQTLKLQYCEKLTMLPSDIHNLVNLRHLDIRETGLEEMPRGISKLNNLQQLTVFIVGKHEENGTRELGKFPKLGGLLEIRKIENVSSSIEALEARIIDKKKLDELSLEWSSSEDNSTTDSRSEMDILNNLQPHQGLESLTIGGYRGTRFAEWVGHSSYHNMTWIGLDGCKNVCTLPSLGQLPSLESLTISELNGLESIGDEFMKNDIGCSSSGTPFPSLQYLEFESMECWEVWRPFESDDAFPQLKELNIWDCPKLRGDLPTHLPALEVLCIESCEQLASCVPRAPAIRELEIVGSSKVVLEELPDSVEDLSIEGRQVESLLSLKYSQSLTAFNCMSLLAELFPPSLESLELRNCGKLEFPELNQNVLVTSLPLQIFFNLSELTIGDWDNLECVSLEGGIPPSLRSLDIQNCEKLLRSPSLATMDMLTTLCIEGPYDGVKSFPEEGLVLLPRSLTYLEIGLLNSVETLDCNGLLHLTSLQTLTIDDCPKLENMVGEMLPASLIILRIDNCPLLEERCKTKHPHIWPKISHITGIRVDDRWIS